MIELNLTYHPTFLIRLIYLFKSFISQQPDSYLWTNSDQSPWGNGNAVAFELARADVLARAALIIRARTRLEEAMAAPATPVRPFLIEVARFQLAERMATNSTVTLKPPPSP